jgi:nucleoid DNA-binding protein
MKLSKEAKEIIEKISLICGLKKDDVKSVFEALSIITVLNYLNGDKIIIPSIGEFQLEYKGDKYENNFKEAIVDGTLQCDDFLLRNIGQIQDNEKTDIEDLLRKKIQASLGEYLNKE